MSIISQAIVNIIKKIKEVKISSPIIDISSDSYFDNKIKDIQEIFFKIYIQIFILFVQRKNVKMKLNVT